MAPSLFRPDRYCRCTCVQCAPKPVDFLAFLPGFSLAVFPSFPVAIARPSLSFALSQHTHTHTHKNMREQLKNSCSLCFKETVMMLEGDVVLGKLKSSQKDENIPIMAHPPTNESDLALKDFLQAVNDSKKDAKLDFKTAEAFEASMEILKNTHNSVRNTADYF